MSAEDKLLDFFEADGTPAIDPHFRITVMSRLAARRFLIEVGIRSLIGLALAVAAWLTLPAIGRVLGANADTLSIIAAVLAITGFVVVLSLAWIRNRISLPRLIGR